MRCLRLSPWNFVDVKMVEYENSLSFCFLPTESFLIFSNWEIVDIIFQDNVYTNQIFLNQDVWTYCKPEWKLTEDSPFSSHCNYICAQN